MWRRRNGAACPMPPPPPLRGHLLNFREIHLWMLLGSFYRSHWHGCFSRRTWLAWGCQTFATAKSKAKTRSVHIFWVECCFDFREIKACVLQSFLSQLKGNKYRMREILSVRKLVRRPFSFLTEAWPRNLKFLAVLIFSCGVARYPHIVCKPKKVWLYYNSFYFL